MPWHGFTNPCFLKSFFEWIFATAFLNISNLVDFCTLFSCSRLCWVFSFIFSMCTWVACPFNKITYKKKINSQIVCVSVGSYPLNLSSSLEITPGENHYSVHSWWATNCGMCCSFCLNSALEFLSTCKLANLTVKAELGCCLLHRKGRLTIDGCILQCESNPLDYLSCPIVSTATGSQQFPSSLKGHSDGVFVSQTRIEGGAKAVSTSGDLELQRVRVIYARTSLLFWFDVEHQWWPLSSWVARDIIQIFKLV